MNAITKEIFPRKKFSVALVIVGLVLQSFIVTIGFLYKYTNGDTMISAGAAKIYASLSFPEPFFFGQPYIFLFESILAIPLVWAGLRADISTMVVCIGLFYLPVLLLMMYTYSRNILLCVFIGISPLLISFSYVLISQIPYGLMGSVGLGAAACVIYLFDDARATSRKICLCLLGACVASYSATSLLIPLILLRGKGRELVFSMTYFIIGFLLIYSLNIFYALNPSYIVHAAPGLSISGKTFVENISNPEIYQVFFSSIPFLWVMVIIAVFRVRDFNVDYIYSLFGYLILVALAFATTKIRDGGESYFFSRHRFFVASSFFFVIYFSYLFRNAVSANLFKDPKLYNLALVVMVLNMIQLTRLHFFIESNVPKVAAIYSYPIVPLANREYLKSTCDRVSLIMGNYQAALIDGRNDLIAYGCTVLTGKQIVQKIYERRTWMKAAIESDEAPLFLLKADQAY